MLHLETITGETYQLLKMLTEDTRLAGFNLAGGTALALYMGHRKSIDLDLFTPEPFNAPELERYLNEKYGFKGDYLENNTLKGSIDGVKIDCITHRYPNVEPTVAEGGLRLYGVRDIAAMKLNAIADSGTRLKDFIDIACLSTLLPLSSMLDAYQVKYSSHNPFRPVKGLVYYDDIDFHDPIQMIGSTYDWKSIEQRISAMLNDPNKIFASFPVKAPRHVPSVAPKKKTPKL